MNRQRRCSFRPWMRGWAGLVGLVLGAAPGVLSAAPPPEDPWPEDPLAVFQQAGVSTDTKGALSNIVLRGYQRENLAFTFDGAPWFGATPFRVDAPPSLLRFMEPGLIRILKGPYDLSLAGGAGGSVEILSPEVPRRLGGHGTVALDSQGMREGRAALDLGGDLAGLRLGFLGRTSEVPEAGDGVPLTGIAYPNPANAYRPGSEALPMYRVQSLWTHGHLLLSEDLRLDLSGGAVHGTDIKIPMLTFDVQDETAYRLNGRMTLRNPLPRVRELGLLLWWGLARAQMDDAFRASSDPDNGALPYRAFLTRPFAMSNRFASESWGAQVDVHLAAGPGALRVGLDGHQRDWNATHTSLLKSDPSTWRYVEDQSLIPDVATRHLGVFATWEVSLASRLRGSLSLREDTTRLEARGFMQTPVQGFQQAYFANPVPTERAFTGWSGNAQLRWQATPGLEVFLRGGRGRRAPDANDLYIGQARMGSSLVGNPFLDQVRVHQADAGALWTGQAYRAELTAFCSRASGFIQPGLIPDPDGMGPLLQARTSLNVDADLYGLEFDGSVKVRPRLTLATSLTWSQGRNLSTGRPLAEMPPAHGRLALRYRGTRLAFGGSWNLRMRQDRVDPALNESPMPGFGVVDLNGSLRLGPGILTAAVQNLFDLYYVQPLSYRRDPLAKGAKVPANGRTLLFSFTWQF